MPHQLKKQIPRSCNRHHFCKALCHGQPTPPLCGGPNCHCKDCQGPSPQHPSATPSPRSPGATPSPSWVPNPTPAPWSPNPTQSPEGHTPSPSPKGTTPSSTPVSKCKNTLDAYTACGGINSGSGDAQMPDSCCSDGFSCVRSNPYYWQCLPTSNPTPTPSPEGYTPSPTPWSPAPTPTPTLTPPPKSGTPSPSPKGTTPSSTPVSKCKNTLDAYSACGGINTDSGDAQMPDSCCSDGFSCVRSNPYYWQCLPASTPTPSPESYTPSPTPWTPPPNPTSTPPPKSSTPSPSQGGPPSPSHGGPPSPPPTPVSKCKNTLDAYSACGGINTDSGDAQMPDSCCSDGFSCVRSNPYYWQCLPASTPTRTPTPTPSPEGYTPSPTSWSPAPTPTPTLTLTPPPKSSTPSPSHGGPTPSPTPWSPTPSTSTPQPSGSSPSPSGGTPTPTPAATMAPTPIATPAPVCIPGQGTWCLAPGYGAYVGVALDFNQFPTIANYSSAAGWNPASYNLYVNFPLKEGDKGLLNHILPQIAGLNAIALITVEPWGGLDSCTEQAAADLADLIHQYELQGLTIIIRFAHEMNGR